jgi:homoserine kinase
MASINRVTFRANMAQVSVPSTSANLGPGFDSFGIALEQRDRYAAQILDDATFDVDVAGEGSEEVAKDKNHLVIKSMLRAFEFMGAKPKGIALRALNVTPHGRGLGSSSSAIVGGLLLARNLVLSGQEFMSDQELIELATDIEGHPDNVAAAFLGGATIAWTQSHESIDSKGKTLQRQLGRAVRVPIHKDIKAIAFVADKVLSTSKARKLLPTEIAHKDAAFNAARAGLLIHALEHRPDLLLTATEDLLHQEYRRSGMPASLALMHSLRSAGHAAIISGAGPTVLVLHAGGAEQAAQICGLAPTGFTATALEIAAGGAISA